MSALLTHPMVRAESVYKRFGAREVADSLVLMDNGLLVERGVPREVIANPQHERTRAFLSKVL